MKIRSILIVTILTANVSFAEVPRPASANEKMILTNECGKFDVNALETALRNPSDAEPLVVACAVWTGISREVAGYRDSVSAILPNALENGDDILKVAALVFISHKVSTIPISRQLVEGRLSDKNYVVRFCAIEALDTLDERISPEAEELISKDLDIYLEKQQLDLALAVAVVLVDLGSDLGAERAVSKLEKVFSKIRALTEKQQEVPLEPEPYFGAANRFYRIKSPERRKLLSPIVPTLLAILNTNISMAFRTNLVVDIGNLSDSSKSVVDALCRQANFRDAFLIQMAQRSLKLLGRGKQDCETSDIIQAQGKILPTLK